MRREKGSALITVVLVVFVLTMVGIAGVLYMTMEDRLSGNEKLQQVALYAAEDGLRVAETVVATEAANSSTSLNILLNPSSTIPNLTPPGGGYAAVPLVVGTTTFHEIAVAMPTGAPGQANYSIFVRNNTDDTTLLSDRPTRDEDQRINIISMARVTDPSGRGITKILEEQMFLGGMGGGERLMKGGNMGGTGAAGIGKSR
jgi:hypothetical protein